MTLFNKGILLIALPILAQFAFVLVLLGAYRTAEEVTWRDLQYRNQTAELMSVTILCYKAVGVLTYYGFTQDKRIMQGFDAIYDSLVKKSESLHLSAEGKEADETGAAENNDGTDIRDNLRKSIVSLAAAKQLARLDRKQIINRVMLAHELSANMESLLANLEKAIARRSREGAVEAAALERSRWTFLSLVLGGFALNMAMCAVLLAVYARDFATRFSVLVDNTRRLPQGLSLNAPVKGSDELTELDAGFHEMNRALKQAEERRNQLISMVTHDLRNPLTAIALNLEVIDLIDDGALHPEIAAKITGSRRMIERLNTLVNDMLDMEKLRAGKLILNIGIVEPRTKVQQALDELFSIASKAQVTLINDVQPEIAVIADGQRFMQIIVNLLSNAIKYSPEGGKVTVSAKQEGEFIKITVSDEGPGVPEEYRDVIFLPFEQVPDDKRGKTGSTGLGLPICKMLVDLQEGTIGVYCDKGSHFWFTLPHADIEEI